VSANLSQSTSYHGRALKLGSSQLKDFIVTLTNIRDDVFRRYPEVIGGISGGYKDYSYEGHDVNSISSLITALDEDNAMTLFCIGSVDGINLSFTFYCDIVENTANLEIRIQNGDQDSIKYKEKVLKSFDKLFPYEPYTRVDRFLLQRGFQFKSAPTGVFMAHYRSLSSAGARQRLRREMGADKYGPVFESYCASVAKNELYWEVRMNVKLLSEGTGGDYDVLALSDASNDLIYIEAKTGSSLNRSDLKNIIMRHKFLRPAFTIIAVDLSKKYTEPKINDFLTEVGSDYEEGHAPAFEVLSGTKSKIVTAHRNIFITSNEDLRQAFAFCMRHYDGVIRQTAYWS
jgi:hypothetical protein